MLFGLLHTQLCFKSVEMMRLVNFQLEDGRPWDIVSTSITGYGEMGLPSYAMPGWDLYMFVPDDASIAATKQAMADVMAGLEPQVPSE